MTNRRTRYLVDLTGTAATAESMLRAMNQIPLKMRHAFAHPAVVGIVTLGTPPARAEVPVIQAGAAFRCSPIAVWDGDGPIWCAEGPKLRLAGIAAREIDGSCRPGKPCPSASGIAARDRLVTLLRGRRGMFRTGHVAVKGPTLTCQSQGNAKGDRTAAWCSLPDGSDLSCKMIESGTALRWRNYDTTDRCYAGFAK
jgi:endonuclease YncB( thermonuclease family)